MSVQKLSVCVLNECSMCGVDVPHIAHVYEECIFTMLVQFHSRTGFPVSCHHCHLGLKMQNQEKSLKSKCLLKPVDHF